MTRSTIHALMTALIAVVLLATMNAQSAPSGAWATRLGAEIPALLKTHQEPGIAVVVLERCEPSIHTFGIVSRETNAPVQPDTVFNLGSISKTLTAWTAMTLVEAGRVQLDSPVDGYLKRWRLPDSSFDRSAVTVRRLLNHTAGISMPSASAVDRGAPLPSLLDELNGLGPTKTRVEIASAPGETFNYSAGGYAILQLMVEDVTGEPFAAYAARTVFGPLGMPLTSFGWTPETAARAATPYLGDGSPYRLREFAASSAAGLVSTPRDMANFLQAQCLEAARSSRNAALGAATVEQMRTGGIDAPPLGRGARYGLGYGIFPGPSAEFDMAGHSGSNQGWKAEFMLMPAQGLGIVVLTNGGNGNVRNDVLRMFRDEIRARVGR